MNSRRDGAANDIHKWPHPKKFETKLTLGPFHSTTLLDLHKRKGAYRGGGMSAASPFRPSGGGAV